MWVELEEQMRAAWGSVHGNAPSLQAPASYPHIKFSLQESYRLREERQIK